MGDDNNSPLFHQKSSYDTNTKILLSAIVSLSLVVILVIILHIYARCLMRRQARRDSALRRLNFIISTHAAAIDARNNGLDPSIIASLPLCVHKRSETDNNHDKEMMGFSSKECSVCLSTYEDGEMVRTLPNCKHSFHAECIDKWFGSNSTCPVCRMEAEPAVDAAGAPPSAPPLEGTSGGGGGDHKVSRSMSSRFSYSFRRMLSRERSSRRMQSSSAGDLENGGTDRDQGQ